MAQSNIFLTSLWKPQIFNVSLGDTWLLRNAGNTTEVWRFLEKKYVSKFLIENVLKTIYQYILIGYGSSKNLKNNFARFVSIKLIYQKK